MLAGEREEQQLDDDGGQKDRNAEIAEITEEEVHQFEHRLGDEVEPAPVDQKVELRDRVGLLVAIDQRHLLGTGKDQGLQLCGLARRDRHGILLVVSLEARAAIGKVFVFGFVGQVLRRHDGGGPVLVGNAEPAGGGLLMLGRNVVFHLAIGNFVEAMLADDADEALVQHVDAWGCRLVEAGHASIGGHRHRSAAAIVDRIDHLEHEMVVDRDRAGENQTLLHW